MSGYQNILAKVSKQSDEELLQQIAIGDQNSFNILFQKYWEELFVTAAKVLRDKESARDIVQDVFLSIWKRKSELLITGSLRAYLYTSVRYHCIHFIKKNITRRDYLVVLTETIVSNTPVDAETEIYIKQLREIVQRTVEGMPVRMKEVYKLSRYEHLTHKQISDHLNISIETVRKHIQHALHFIQVNLPPYISRVIIILFLSFPKAI